MMKNAVLAALLVLGGVMVGCAPTANDPGDPVTLVTNSTGSVQTTGLRVYRLNLSCGCAFPMKVEAVDTTQGVVYEYPDITDTSSFHTIQAKAAPGLTSGTHIGYLALVTVPPTKETFRDTLRDTIIVP